MVLSLTSIRAEDRYLALNAFVTLFIVMVGHAALETARDALFLASIPAKNLPWVYLGIAGMAYVVHLLESRIPEDSLGTIVSGWLVASSLITVGFWYFLESMGELGLYALYIWSGLLVTVVLVHFWALLSGFVTAQSAKPLFAFVGSGSVAGAIVGSGIAAAGSMWMKPQDLLLVTAATLALAAIGPWMLSRNTSQIEKTEGMEHVGRGGWETFQQILNRPYATRLVLLVFVSTVTVTCVDFIFKGIVADTISADNLASFFGVTYLVLNILSFVVQLALVRGLIRRLGVPGALVILPALLVLGGLGALLGSVLLGAMAMKAFDGALRHSLHRTALELLYVPLGNRFRFRLKSFVGVVSHRGGQSVASLVVLLGVFLEIPYQAYVLLALVLGVLWVLLANSLRGHYLDLFRNVLSSDVMVELAHPDLDLASLETLLEALNSPEDSRVIAAMEIMEEEGKGSLIPMMILYHPATEVVLTALEIFSRSGRRDFLAIIQRIEASAEPRLQATMLALSTRLNPNQAILEERLGSARKSVVITAEVLMVAQGWAEKSEYQEDWEQTLQSGRVDELLAMVTSILHSPAGEFEPELAQLAWAPDAEVRLIAIRALKRSLTPSHYPTSRARPTEVTLNILQNLLIDRVTRAAALDALKVGGEAALDFLAESLGNRDLPKRVRWQLPRAIGAFGSDRAVTILLRVLNDEASTTIRYRIARELEALRRMNPARSITTDLLRTAIERHISIAYQLVDWRVTVERELKEREELQHPAQMLLVSMLRDREANEIELLLRLLGLHFDITDIGAILRGLRSKKPQRLASSQELLEHALKAPYRSPMLALVDGRPDIERALGAPEFHQPTKMSYEELLPLLLDGDHEYLRLIAAHLVEELKLKPLRSRLEVLEESNPPSALTDSIQLALREFNKATGAFEGN